MAALTHRKVRPEDVPRICSFPQSAEELFFLFPKATFPLTAAQLMGAITQRFDSTVVTEDDVVRGFANFYVREPGGTCAIGNVVVDPAARGRGIGAYLIETMATEALVRHEARVVKISCFHGNVAGLLLYARLGFAPYAVEERRDPAGARVALMHMRMAEAAASRLRG